ncbi:TPA: hypothetical protein DEO28_01795 [Candidatus Dependentiae bacterium]|nr:MAG: hypothetical protein UR14_C0004G0049 [candidate division TM6 bacterium GW2011_GWE2_31_21]KKP52967.1 MAG: hypothetical protein UR43_C0008G0049 [candidate division TM6 bacterium GW2011_GWF2_33_332]HBS47795.1 hypothetical protein [Candidatus Dependentiae bacterium]HBZ73229.1 hypothetical protein [Candidatus Dependentiae bacterium]
MSCCNDKKAPCCGGNKPEQKHDDKMKPCCKCGRPGCKCGAGICDMDKSKNKMPHQQPPKK